MSQVEAAGDAPPRMPWNCRQLQFSSVLGPGPEKGSPASHGRAADKAASAEVQLCVRAGTRKRVTGLARQGSRKAASAKKSDWPRGRCTETSGPFMHVWTRCEPAFESAKHVFARLLRNALATISEGTRDRACPSAAQSAKSDSTLVVEIV